jgi:hypothetical protein
MTTPTQAHNPYIGMQGESAWRDGYNKGKCEREVEWKCKAQRTADPPQDCDWPVCGCDPYADKVIAALEESGATQAGPLK